ncbi:MAG: putative glycoside hydrolase [Bulleidia sp.]
MSAALFTALLGCQPAEQWTAVYLAGNRPEIILEDLEGNTVTLPRGTQVLKSDQEQEDGSIRIRIDETEFHVRETVLCDDMENCVKETEMYVNETVPALTAIDGYELSGFVSYRDSVNITGHSPVKDDGTVAWYQTDAGFVSADHLEFEPIQDNRDYDAVHAGRKDLYGGGGAAGLDYTPHSKMPLTDVPQTVSALYLNGAAIENIDSYIGLADNGNVNTFVIDIKDADVIAVKAETMKEYSPSSYDHGLHPLETYCDAIQRVKQAGIYTVGRITVFKDTWYAGDHPEHAIIRKDDGSLFELGGALWPSGYSHDVWEYNVRLAVEMAQKAGFDEIQFDYVRFPESVDYYHDILGCIDLRNTENISRVQAIQQFLLYACEILHRNGIAVSADVFGETANDYVSAYGQYWPAISNVVDAICAMPYPDHFSIHDYGIPQAVWEVPEQLLSQWGAFVQQRQQEIPTPARVVTYIQGYDSLRPPYVIYDRQKIEEQIQGLINAGIHDGHIIWNSGSDYYRYLEYTK